MTLMNPTGSGSHFNVSNMVTLRMAEYTALRDEIVKRVAIQHLLSTVAVAAAGIQLGQGTLVLYYPILATFLSFSWAASDRRVRRLGAYILGRIEAVVGDDIIGWEHFARGVEGGGLGR